MEADWSIVVPSGYISGTNFHFQLCSGLDCDTFISAFRYHYRIDRSPSIVTLFTSAFNGFSWDGMKLSGHEVCIKRQTIDWHWVVLRVKKGQHKLLELVLCCAVLCYVIGRVPCGPRYHTPLPWYVGCLGKSLRRTQVRIYSEYFFQRAIFTFYKALEKASSKSELTLWYKSLGKRQSGPTEWRAGFLKSEREKNDDPREIILRD